MAEGKINPFLQCIDRIIKQNQTFPMSVAPSAGTLERCPGEVAFPGTFMTDNDSSSKKELPAGIRAAP